MKSLRKVKITLYLKYHAVLDVKILDHLSQFKDTLKPATEKKTHEQDTKRLNDAVVKLESRNKELTHKLGKAEHEKNLLEGKLKDEKQAQDITKNQHKMYRQSESQEENFLSKRLDLRNKMISDLEISVNNLKKLLEEKEKETISLKIHYGSVHAPGQFENQKHNNSVDISEQQPMPK